MRKVSNYLSAYIINLGYTHALRVLFENEECLKAYDQHQEHAAFKATIPFEDQTDPKRTICIDWFQLNQ